MRPYLARQARDRPGGGGRDRGGAGVRAGVHRDQEDGVGQGGVVLVHQGRPAGHLLLLLPLGRRFRAGVRQGVRLFPVPDEDLAQRARVGQTAGHQGRDRVHRAVQRVRHVPPILLGCRRSATGSARARSGCSPNAGGRSCRCRSPSTTAPPAIGGSCRCARSRPRAPWCSTHRGTPAGSSRRWSPTTSTSAARS